jgi:hypothetical protein
MRADFERNLPDTEPGGRCAVLHSALADAPEREEANR